MTQRLDAWNLDDKAALNVAAAGAKAAGLARLRQAGFEVPDGRILPVGIADAWPSGLPPDGLRQLVADACEALGERIAVRASATWEDAATSAHAGATTTILDVKGVDNVLDAIRRCLDDSTQAQCIRGGRGGIAVLLQRLVPAEWAGVAFSADPLTGDRDVVRIAGTPGLGEALVQGEVVGTDLAVRGETIEGDLAGMRQDDALAVAKAVRRIEADQGVPQDVEWAIAAGTVHVLQARPITVLPVQPTCPTGNNWQKDVAHYPEPVTPFGWSALQLSEEDIRSVFDETGVLIRGFEEVFVGGEIYGRPLPAFGSADNAAAAPPALVLGIVGRLLPPLRRRTSAAKRVIAANRFQAWADEWHSRDRERMKERGDELASVGLGSLDDAELLDHLERCADLVREGTRIHFRLIMPLFGALFRLHCFATDELGWDDAETFRMLAGQSPAIRAAAEALADIRARIRELPGAADGLAAAPHRPIEALTGIDAGIATAVNDWLDVHGWAMVNYDAGVPVLAERLSTITKLLLNDPDPVDFADADAVAERARAELVEPHRARFDALLAAARAAYPLREDNTIVVVDRPLALLRRWMLEVARRLVDREVLDAAADAAYLTIDELRDALAGLSTAGLTDLVLRRRGEEAWARAHPGPVHVGKQGEMPDISRMPAALRTVNEPILWGVAHEYPPPADVPEAADVLLAGVAASAGVAEGTVRVIRGHHEIDLLTEGDILVCRVTSPAWAPLFSLAAAIVADGGGALSHAAIAAREHGIPAVLGTGNATSSLQDGQRVRVDGTRGIVLAVG